MNKKNIITNSAEETQKIAEDLAKSLEQPVVISLSGDLGAGKTTFTQGFARGLGVTQKIISPTFIIMREYALPTRKFYHVDLYRLESEKDLRGIGLLEVLKQNDSLVVIEWPEKMGKFLPEKRIDIQLEYVDEGRRKLTICKK